MTPEEESANVKTLKHILMVRDILNTFIKELMTRGENHDLTKLESPEVELFAKYTPMLESLTFGTPEYEESLNNLKPALDHHFAQYRHHPEHFEDGVNDMNLIDIIELFADWYAASKRQNNGNIRKSIDKNAAKYKICKQLTRIFENTIDVIDS